MGRVGGLVQAVLGHLHRGRVRAACLHSLGSDEHVCSTVSMSMPSLLCQEMTKKGSRGKFGVASGSVRKELPRGQDLSQSESRGFEVPCESGTFSVAREVYPSHAERTYDPEGTPPLLIAS
jgi:hypothetical protein